MKLILVQPQLRLAPDADNFATLRAVLDPARIGCGRDDIVLLPEAVDQRPDGYERDLAALARSLGCHVVGGSRHEMVRGGVIIAGLVVDPSGAVIGRYEKLHPYADERQLVRPGSSLGEVTIGGRNVLVLVCADFWFTDLFQRTTRPPDLILVAALSITRKPTPAYSRALWRHLAVARAYEFGVYVGISDWGYPSELPALFACGVGGFADPTATVPEQFFAPIGESEVAVCSLDFGALETLRCDRTSRGFFWRDSPDDIRHASA